MNPDLKNIPTEALYAEIEDRKLLERQTGKPFPLDQPDFNQVRNLCVKYIDELAENGYVDEDLPHYIHDAAMTCTFGPDVWKWINKRQS